MDHLYKGKAKYILAWLPVLVFMLIAGYCDAIGVKAFYFHNGLTTDTIPEALKKGALAKQTDSTSGDPALFSDSLQLISKRLGDTVIVPVADTFSFRSSKDSLDAPVIYHADDSMVIDVPTKKLTLYGKESTVKYVDNELGAPMIEYDQQTSLIKAVLSKDTLGNVIAYPFFNQGDFKSKSDTLLFNMKTGKGLTKGTYTMQGEMFVYGEKIKKVDEDIFYALRGRFTTCNLDTPHFSFVSSKIKFINDKMAYSGPVHPEFEGVPLPIVLPFGIFPLTQGRHSGFIAPSFSANDQLGLALEGIGYYKVLSDNWDITARGTIYSYGGYTANINPRYFRKYRYQGNFGLDYQNIKTGFKGDPDFSSTKTMNVRWSHSADTKARPGVTFNGNVNAGSSKFNATVPNSPQRNFTNQLNSSITYAKVWKDKPFNLSVSANHNQNTQQRLININFPDVSFNINTQYPFRRKEATGAYKWYENIGIALNTNARSLSSFYDTAAAAARQLSKNFRWGATHNVPITLSLPSLGPVQISPSVSYQERWYQQKSDIRWNSVDKKLDTSVNRGFYTARDMSFSLGAATRIFGSYVFRKTSKVQAIRHEIRPSISASFKPDFNAQNFYTAPYDSAGNVVTRSVFENSVFGAFGSGRFAGLTFGIDNNIQMKVRNKKDTAEGAVKKVTILDGFGINGSYNFLADSFKLSNFNISARSNLFEKFSITANAQLDPYATDANGQRIDKFVWSERPSLGALTSGGISLASQFQGGENKGAPMPGGLNNNTQFANTGGMPLDEYQQEAMYMSNNPGEFADFSIPWTVDFSYSLRFSKTRAVGGGFTKTFNQDVTFNNSINLSPKWKIGLQGSYNLTLKELGVLSMYLSRDLHCWQMTINIAPVGRFRFFTINISPKSPMLRDLKVNRTRSFYDL